MFYSFASSIGSFVPNMLLSHLQLRSECGIPDLMITS